LAAEELKPAKERRPLPQAPKEMADAAAGKKMSKEEVDAMNESAYQQWEDKSLDRCPHCSRTFRPEALAKHQKMCTAERPFRQAGTGLTSASLSANLKPGALSGTMRQTANLASVQEKRVSGRSGPVAKVGSKAVNVRASLPSKLPSRSSDPDSPGTPTRPVSRATQKPQAGKVLRASADDVTSKMSGMSLGGGGSGAPPASSGSGGSMATFCDECGTKFERDTAKFCTDCGTPRLKK